MYKQISVTGRDAIDFLQGQLTQDVSLLAEAGQLPAAWCNPKGRVITTMQLILQHESIGVVVPANICDRVFRRLQMYKLRSEVNFEIDDSEWRQYLNADSLNPEKLIRAGVPTIDNTNSEKYTPHMLNLDKLGAISFTKGCYTGQEVVARTENLGKSKRRLMIYEADSEEIAVGDRLADADTNVGEVVNVSGPVLLAVTPLEVHTKTLQSNGATLVPLRLPYSI